MLNKETDSRWAIPLSSYLNNTEPLSLVLKSRNLVLNFVSMQLHITEIIILLPDYRSINRLAGLSQGQKLHARQS